MVLPEQQSSPDMQNSQKGETSLGQESKEVKKDREVPERPERQEKKVKPEEINLYDRIRKEAVEDAVGVLEKKTGISSAFSQQDYKEIATLINERFSSVLAPKAEDYLKKLEKDRPDLAGKVNFDAQGTIAVEAILILGAENAVIEGDTELERLFFLKKALEEFSRDELPPSARFAILRELNEMAMMSQSSEELTEKLRKLRIETFRKWSGRDPEVSSSGVRVSALDEFDLRILPEELRRLTSALSGDDRSFARDLGIDDETFAMLKAQGYRCDRVRRWGWVGPRRVRIIRDGNEIVFGDVIGTLKTSFAERLRSDRLPAIEDKIRKEFESQFLNDVTDVRSKKVEQHYKDLRENVHAMLKKRLERENEPEEKGGMLAGLTGDYQKDKDTLLQSLKRDFGFDVQPDWFDKFMKGLEQGGIDYKSIYQNRHRFSNFISRLVKEILGQAKKVTANVG